MNTVSYVQVSRHAFLKVEEIKLLWCRKDFNLTTPVKRKLAGLRTLYLANRSTGESWQTAILTPNREIYLSPYFPHEILRQCADNYEKIEANFYFKSYKKYISHRSRDRKRRVVRARRNNERLHDWRRAHIKRLWNGRDKKRRSRLEKDTVHQEAPSQDHDSVLNEISSHGKF